MRRDFDGLAADVAQTLRADPYSGAAFVFRSKRGDYGTASRRREARPEATPRVRSAMSSLESSGQPAPGYSLGLTGPSVATPLRSRIGRQKQKNGTGEQAPPLIDGLGERLGGQTALIRTR